jgi:peptidoglycan/xylan/chitin deacetylase (PgdA/CDA1 family)
MFVVTYHDVLGEGEEPDALDWPSLRLPRRSFEREMAYLARRFHPQPLAELLRQLERGRVDPLGVVVTFDDGCYGVLAHALPVLERWRIPAAVFVATGHCGAPVESEVPHFHALEAALRLSEEPRLDLGFWGDPPLPLATPADRNRCLELVKAKLKLAPEADRRRWHAEVLAALRVSPRKIREYAAVQERFRTLSWEELRRLAAAGVTIGSHTRSHRTLSRLGPEELEDEIAGACGDLQSRLGLAEVPFAYPYGGIAHIGAAAPEVARRAGHSCALSTIPGRNTASTDRFLLHRLRWQELRRLAAPPAD